MLRFVAFKRFRAFVRVTHARGKRETLLFCAAIADRERGAARPLNFAFSYSGKSKAVRSRAFPPLAPRCSQVILCESWF